MANRFKTNAEVEGARVWYSPEARFWWMDPKDHVEAYRLVQLCPDAIHVTNAYELLSYEFISELMVQANR